MSFPCQKDFIEKCLMPRQYCAIIRQLSNPYNTFFSAPILLNPHFLKKSLGYWLELPSTLNVGMKVFH